MAAHKNILRNRIQKQSVQIERFFAERHLPAAVFGGVVERDSVQFDLGAQLATNLQRLKELASDIGQSLGIPGIEIDRENGLLRLCLPRKGRPETALFDVLAMLPSVPRLAATLGLSENGSPLLLDFSDIDVSHVLLGGDPGAGKSNLLRTICVSLALTNKQSQVQLAVLNPRSGNGSSYTILEPLSYLPHLLFPTVYNHREAAEVLIFLSNELDYRDEQDISCPSIIVLIDEFAEFVSEGGERISDLLLRLLQRGTQRGIHFVLGTSLSPSDALDEALKANIPIRIAGRLESKRSANAISGDPAIQAEYLAGSGDFVAIASGGEPIRFQAAHVNDEDLYAAVEELHRNRPPSILAVPASVRAMSTTSEGQVNGAEAGRRFVFDGQGVSWAEDEPEDKAFDSGDSPVPTHSEES